MKVRVIAKDFRSPLLSLYHNKGPVPFSDAVKCMGSVYALFREVHKIQQNIFVVHKEPFSDVIRNAIIDALWLHKGSQIKAAEHLNVSERVMAYRVQTFNLKGLIKAIKEVSNGKTLHPKNTRSGQVSNY